MYRAAPRITSLLQGGGAGPSVVVRKKVVLRRPVAGRPTVTARLMLAA
jgi:hypothetical protein